MKNRNFLSRLFKKHISEIQASGKKDTQPVKPSEKESLAGTEVAGNEPPLICWKGQLYRQKWVDGGLEAYGEPLGPC